MKPIDPKYVPKLARQVARWQREYGPIVWSGTALRGSPFFAPPSLPPLIQEAGGYMLNPDSKQAERVPSDATMESFRGLTAYYAETLETSKSFHVDEKLTNLALRTQMSKYKLTLDMLRVGKDNQLIPRGFIVWDMPIGQAEQNERDPVLVDFRTGEVEEVSLPTFNPFAAADFPVVAASWRYEPEANSVWVAFYTQTDERLRVLKERGDGPEEIEAYKKFLEPLAMEREQELPLDQSLSWCDSEDEPRLAVTAFFDPNVDRERRRQLLLKSNTKAAADVSDWVRVLISSLMIMKWKIATREVIPPPQDIIRKVAKETGHSKKTAAREAGTTVVRLGAPIRKRGSAATAGTKKGAWKVRALVGPVVRDRQYIPAWDAYDENPRFIEPFWMGPEDAPISNLDRVFVLGDG